MTDESAPLGIDVNVPNAARMYDYYLGGDNNFPADREAAERVLRTAPWIRATALENRAMMGRAVHVLAAEHGLRQFIDVGAGLPTRGNVHEVGQAVAPDTRVVYVDNDPVVLGHNRALLSRATNATTVRADLRHPEGILSHPELDAVIDWGKPIVLLLVAVMHFVTDDDDPVGIVGQFRAKMAPGSHIVITHLYHPSGDAAAMDRMTSIYRNANVPLLFRTADEVQRLFAGFDLLDPGLVQIQHWRPNQPPDATEEIWGLGGVGRLS